MSKAITVAQVGCGYWGPNLLRVFSSLSNCSVKWVAEASSARRAFVEANFPGTKTCVDVETVLDDASVDAVVIATPAATHAELVERFLNAGKQIGRAHV